MSKGSWKYNPIVCCIECRKEFKLSGINTHYLRTHLKDSRFSNSGWKKGDPNHPKQNGYTKNEDYELSDESREKIRLANIGRKHSEKTKEKISKKRKEFLHKNPDKVPYLLNHYSRGPSYPETYWKEVLEQNVIVYEPEYKISSYSLDFAILDKKIDLEIDGEQHYLDERIVKSDKRRNEYLMNNGWQIIRVRWSEFQKLDKQNKIDYIQSIVTKIKGL